MLHFIGGYRGLSLILDLTKDRILVVAGLCVALYAAAFIASF